MSGSIILNDINNQTYSNICLTTIWSIIKTSNSFKCNTVFCHLQVSISFNVTYHPVSTSWRDAVVYVRQYYSRGHRISEILSNTIDIRFTILSIIDTSIWFYLITVFYNLQGNVTVKATYNNILAIKLRIRRTCPGVCMKMTQIKRHILIYACWQFDLSLIRHVNLIGLLCFIIYMAT